MESHVLEVVDPVRADLVPVLDCGRLVERFLDRGARTRAAYAGDLEDFAGFVGARSADLAIRALLERGHGPANGLALDYRAALLSRGLAPATVNRRLAALRSVVALARMVGLVPWTLSVEAVKSRTYRDTRGPGLGAFAEILALLERDIQVATSAARRAKAIRDRAVVRLLFDMGLRRGEVVSLDMIHLDLDGGRLSILGKGRTEREGLTIPPPVAAALRAWVEVRGLEAGPVFVSLDRASKGDGRLRGGSVERLVARLGERVGKRVRPHGLRHTAITRVLDLTRGDVRQAQRFSRHADVRTLARYDDDRADVGGKLSALLSADLEATMARMETLTA